MSKLLQGRVVYENVSHNNCLQRFIEKQIAKWIIKQPSQVSGEKALLESDFTVSFEKVGSSHHILCRLEIRSGALVWTGVAEAHQLDQALLKTLQHMHPITNPVNPSAWAKKSFSLSQAS